MRFETVPPRQAIGAILVHALYAGTRRLKKGRVLSAADAATLAESGLDAVTVVRLEPGDVGEDTAAACIAAAFAGPGVRTSAAFTGRANLYAETTGVALVVPSAVDAANLVDEAVTIATLAPNAPVRAGDMVATVKIVPYAAPETAVARTVAIAAGAKIAVAAFRPMKAALIATELPGQKASLFAKTRDALEARLAPLGGTLIFERQGPHRPDTVATGLRAARDAGAEIYFVLGASAISDRRDVVPAGIVDAGGKIVHFGMPVDPGNLLLLGTFAGVPVVGLPGCARSPKINGFDFVLQRLFAGLPVRRDDIMRMGVGGLLTETPMRGQPRAADRTPPRAARIAAVVLAAGLSSRMGSNKLLAALDGMPLIRHTLDAVMRSQARPVIVVTGHQDEAVRSALTGLDIQFVHNPDYALGLSTSLKAGIGAVPEACDGAIVVLGDMPEIAPALIDRMIAGFSPADGRAICVANAHGKRGNPVLWARRFFPEIEALTGDVGAKHLVATYDDLVCDVSGDDAVLTDVDTPEALAAVRARAAKTAP